MDPPDAAQFTAVLVVPVTVAENCWLPPTERETVVGETAILTADCAVEAGAAAVTPTHPVLKIETAKTKIKTRKKTKDLTMERDIQTSFRGAV
jgi:hypothetical protein